MEKLTNEQIEAKAAELSLKKDNTVTPIVIITHDDEQIVGYFQEPHYDVLMQSVDYFNSDRVSEIGDMVLKNSLIAEESDPRILSAERKHAKIKASFANASIKLVIPFKDEYKKK